MQETSKNSKNREFSPLSNFGFTLSLAQQQLGPVEDLMYDVDIDGNSLLHLATNSGVLGVSTTV